MVAERAGVSRSAVSRTFTDGRAFPSQPGVKVLEAANALGYTSITCAGLAREEQYRLPCRGGHDHAHSSRMVDVLTRKLQAANKIIIGDQHRIGTESVAAALRQTLNYRADATLCCPAPHSSLIETCLANGQQVVLINRDDRYRAATTLASTMQWPGARHSFCFSEPDANG